MANDRPDSRKKHDPKAVAADGWPWCGLLVTFALLYTTFGTLAFGTLLEES